MAGLGIDRDMCGVGAIRIGALGTGISAVSCKTRKIPEGQWKCGLGPRQCAPSSMATSIAAQPKCAAPQPLAYAFAQFGGGSDYRRGHPSRSSAEEYEPNPSSR